MENGEKWHFLACKNLPRIIVLKAIDKKEKYVI